MFELAEKLSALREQKKGTEQALKDINAQIEEVDFTLGKAVFTEAAELCAYLCKQYGLNETNIICHSEGYKKGIASPGSPTSPRPDLLGWEPR